MLNSVGGVGSVGAWVGGWCELNFGIDPVGRVGPQNFGEGHKKIGRGRNFSVGETYDFRNFRYDTVKFYQWF